MAGSLTSGLGRVLPAIVAAAVALTAASPATAGTGLELRRVGSFDAPVFVEDAPQKRKLLFVVEQPGTIAVMRNGRKLAQPFLDIRDRVQLSSEEGLLSIAFDPEYQRNRRFFVYYVNRESNIQVDSFKRKRGSPTRADPRSRRTLIVIPHPGQTNHNGGQLQFGDDDMLYIGTGDGGGAGDPSDNAQNPESLLGKLLRIDPRRKRGYETPESNPFVGGPGADEVYALGLRNPFRFSFDSGGGGLAIGDVGQNAWEEIDFLSRRQRTRRELRLGQPRGQPLLRGPWHRAAGLSRADPRVRRRLRGDRGLRRPRSAAERAVRAAALRRPQRRRDPVARPVRAEPERDRRRHRPSDRPAVVVRRGGRRQDLRRLARATAPSTRSSPAERGRPARMGRAAGEG